MKNSRNILPNDWRWAKLKEVARVFAGSSAPQDKEFFDQDGPPFVRVRDLGVKKRTTNLVDIQDHLSKKALTECSLVLAKAGTTLFPKSGAAVTTNNRAILGVDAYIVSHLMGVEPKEGFITPLWLYWSLCQINMVDHSDNIAYPSLRQSNVKNIIISLPSFDEQTRIEKILKEQMIAVEKAKSSTEAQLETAKALPAAYLREVFNSPEAQKWPRKRLEEIIIEAQPGFACGERDPNGVVQLRMNNVDTCGNMRWDEFIRVPKDKKLISKYQLVNGDVLFNNTNSVELVGKSALFREYREPIVYSNHFTRLRVVIDKLEPSFLTWWLVLKWQSRLFEHLCNRWIGQSAVKRDKLLLLEILLPPLVEQKRVVAVLNERITSAERLQKMLEEKLDTINKLPHALLRRAFNGEL